MKKIAFFLCGALCCGLAHAHQKTLMLATTTSTDNTGLLTYLAQRFNCDTGIQLKWIAVGTGKALEIGKNCDTDVLLVHAPSAEKKFVHLGYGLHRTQVMYNDFVIIGSKSDPAHIRGTSAQEALKKIALLHQTFVSRGDDSGTNKKEKALWLNSHIKIPTHKTSWYIESGQGMMTTLNMAWQMRAYTLTDRGTFIKFKAEHHETSLPIILVSGGKLLKNQYSVISLNPTRCKNIKFRLANTFKNWMISKKGQSLIANFRLLGKPLFTPNYKGDDRKGRPLH